MHELSLAEAVVREALRAAESAAPGRRVTEVHVEVGELSGAVPELLVDCFPIAAGETALAGACLRVKRVGALLRCTDCGEEFAPGRTVGCPECGSARVEMVRGREMQLTAIEVEDDSGEGTEGSGEPERREERA